MKTPLGIILILLVFGITINPTNLRAQKKDNQGKEFYVAFAENHGRQTGQGSDEYLNFFALFLTSKVDANVTVEVQALGFNKQVAVKAGKITTVELPDGQHVGDPTVEITTSEQIMPGMAVHVTSDQEITVYGMNHKDASSDAFLALPVDVLGTEYRAICYQTSWPSGFAGGGATPSEFWVVCVTDSTNVTITPKAITQGGQPANVPIKLLMYKGDVYLVEGTTDVEANDLTGSLIEADQPVAVLSGHVRAEIPHGYTNQDNPPLMSRDHLVEQLPPVSAWGDSAVVVRFAGTDLPDLVRVVSSEDGNEIRVNGVLRKTLQAGEFFQIDQLTAPVAIHATSPILVGQYMHTSIVSVNRNGRKPNGDPALALVFPVEQYDTAYTFMLDENSAFDKNYVNIVADPGGTATMMLDGTKITAPPYSAAFLPIPGSRYVYAQIPLPQGSHNIYSTMPFGITVYALGPVDSYAYPGGTLLKTITPFKTVDLVIDFGDRVMTAENTPPAAPGTYLYTKNYWDTTVYLQNISSDPYLIEGFATRTGDDANFEVIAPKTPPAHSIGPGAIDSMTIRFKTIDPDVRKHTKINAVTEHLRAYVVDVYGRGILPNAQVFADSVGISHIDTLDFGVFDAALDPAKDSFVYIFNKGTAPLNVSSDAIAGIPSFSIPTPRLPKSTPPYSLQAYNLLSLNASSAQVILRFDPAGLANGYYQAEYDVNSQGQSRRVILIARVKTILKSTLTNAKFDTVFLCLEQTSSLFIDNPNDFPVTVWDLKLGGVNPQDFNLITAIPLVIDPKSRGEIKLSYAPSATGVSSATATISLDLPKGFTQTLPLSAFGDQLTSSFWARSNIHILPTEETYFPIYARTPLEKFGSPSFVMTIDYDPSHLLDDPYTMVQENTLTAGGEWDVNTDSIGHSIYSYHTLDGSILRGGGPDVDTPLVYLKFKSVLNKEDNPLHFHQDIDINYNISFDRSPVPPGCILSLAPNGRISLDSTCETVYLLQDTLLFPPETYISPIYPNPVATFAKIEFDKPSDGNLRIDIINTHGDAITTIIDEPRKKGTYKLLWDARELRPGAYFVRMTSDGTVKTRQVVILR
ncbi:MAG: T9SS type A sorting domain-containing protein [bacterium]